MAKAQEMVDLLEQALRQNVGVKQIVVDGQTIQFNDRSALITELNYWQKKAAQEAGKKSLFRSVDLSGGW